MKAKNHKKVNEENKAEIKRKPKEIIKNNLILCVH